MSKFNRVLGLFYLIGIALERLGAVMQAAKHYCVILRFAICNGYTEISSYIYNLLWQVDGRAYGQ